MVLDNIHDVDYVDSGDIVYVGGDADDENDGYIGNEGDERKNGDFTGEDGFHGAYKYAGED